MRGFHPYNAYQGKLGREAGCANVCGCPPAAALSSGVLLVLAFVRSLGPCSGKTFAEVLGLSSFVVLLSVADSDPLGLALFDGFKKKSEIHFRVSCAAARLFAMSAWSHHQT